MLMTIKLINLYVYTKTTSFCYVIKKIKMKQRRFISSRDKTTSFHQPSFHKKRSLFIVLVCRRGEGETGPPHRQPLVWIEELTLFRSKRRRPITGDLVRQASGVDAKEKATAICEATLRHTATATTTEVGFPPLLYLASNRLLRFPSDYPNLDMDVVSGFALFIEICFSCWDFKMVHGCTCNVRPFFVLENIFPVLV